MERKTSASSNSPKFLLVYKVCLVLSSSGLRQTALGPLGLESENCDPRKVLLLESREKNINKIRIKES